MSQRATCAMCGLLEKSNTRLAAERDAAIERAGRLEAEGINLKLRLVRLERQSRKSASFVQKVWNWLVG